MYGKLASLMSIYQALLSEVKMLGYDANLENGRYGVKRGTNTIAPTNWKLRRRSKEKEIPGS